MVWPLAMEGIKTDNIDALTPLFSEMKAFHDELIQQGRKLEALDAAADS